MSIGIFARPNSKAPVAKYYGGRARVWHNPCATPLADVYATALGRCAMNPATEFRCLFLAEAVNETDSAAIISLAGAAIATGTNLGEAGMFVVELDQANRPALLEFHVEAASSHPRVGPAPMAELIEASLRLQVVTGITRTDQHLGKRSDLVAVAQGVNSRAER